MPETRRSFSSDADELDYLADKIRFWLYERGRPILADRRFGGRFNHLLRRNAKRLEGSIALHLHSALLYDLRGDLEREIRHRETAVRLIRRLLDVGGPVGGFDEQRLADETAILASVYEDAGMPPDAAMAKTRRIACSPSG